MVPVGGPAGQRVALSAATLWRQVLNTLDLNISGMACDSCANRIRTLLANHVGVRQATIAWEAGTGQIVYNPQSTGQEQIVALIEAAGFTAKQA